MLSLTNLHEINQPNIQNRRMKTLFHSLKIIPNGLEFLETKDADDKANCFLQMSRNNVFCINEAKSDRKCICNGNGPSGLDCLRWVERYWRPEM